MSDWKPTNELRFLAREISPNTQTFKMIKILQQKWMREDDKSMKQYFEWRDVQTVTDE